MCVLWFYSIVYDVQFGRVLDRIIAHEDAVSCLDFCGHDVDGSVMVTGSWDCSVRVWRKLPVGMKEWKKLRPASTLAAELDHDAHVVCLTISR